ncbi:MAG: twitch domain-containing radical SAM protein [Bacteriovoracaceae bacterium]|nr:twitch domain-containing radical SAM protein [Bacteriovoracaceae bacterium]
MDKNNNIFCLAPWVHAHVDVEGKRALCDFSDPIEGICNNLSLKEYWNSPEIKERRVMMLNGQAPKECHSCSKRRISTEPHCVEFNNPYKYLVPTILRNTKVDGSTSMKPFYYDYRFSNICNFSCKMCSAPNSTLIENETRKFNNINPKQPTLYENRKVNNEKIYLPEFLQNIEKGHVQKISWAGGETLITPEHWEVINKILNLDMQKKICLSYSTNFSIENYKGTKILDILKDFKHISYELSLDGIKEVGEFIRSGLNWETFYTNFKSLPIRSNLDISFAITLTIPGILDIKNLIDFLLEDRLKYVPVFCIGDYSTDVMSPFILPRHLYDQLLDNFEKLVIEYNDPYLDNFIDLIHSMKNTTIIEECINLDIKDFISARKFHSFREQLNPHQITLNEIFKIKSPDIYKWWLKSDDELIKSSLSLVEYRHILHNKEWDDKHSYSSETFQEKVILTTTFNFTGNLETSPKLFYGTNLIREITDPVEYLNKLSRHINKEDRVSLIDATGNIFSSWLNRKNLNSYQNKIILWRLINLPADEWDRKFPNLIILSTNYLSPISFILRNKNVDNRLISIICKFEFLVSFLNPVISLHFRVLFKRRDD